MAPAPSDAGRDEALDAGAGASAGDGVRGRVSVRCISDVHADEVENRRWIEGLAAHPEDVLIVAGDISDNLAIAREALRAFKRKYAKVFCVPGNHDLWISRKEESGITDSIKKLHAFLGMCADEGVSTRPECVSDPQDPHSREVCVVPLLSWHHQSFDTEPDITCWEGIPTPDQCMSDYRRCRWPPPLRQEDDSVARHLDEMNDRVALPADAGTEALPILSFSHFVPRVELNPEKRFLYLPCLNKAVGSRFLGERVERMGSAMHVFGHTHFGWDATHGGTRFVQAALGYPAEWRERPKSMEIGSLPHDPVIVWDSRDGFAPRMPARWSDYYERNPRRPDVTHLLAPYVAPMYRQLPGGEVCDWPMGPPPART